MVLEIEKVEDALRAVIAELDYDLHKELENPEDPDSEDNYTYANLAALFIEAYIDADL